ncbi:M20 family peptidase [Oleomonas cavernae]|uniref:M20 family peptidase n=1 Tax=Oleomonas cavernae TaxID=2320859 RepID=A0A418WU33_9PROT|nr:M20/M25/M40 family metallo-hydrolase [Oleomonas cavernae]RJF94745.1 M20 family peptidase [Oleomonas cavernae]
MTPSFFLERLRARTPDMLTLLEALVQQDSGSHDIAGVNAVGARLAQEWRALGFIEERRAVPGRGDLRLLRRLFPGRGRLLILGHLDTVWPAGTAATWGFAQDGHHAHGPGVGDMKGGLVMALFALRELLAAGFEGLAEVACLLVPDEELGSVGSRAHIEREAARSDWVLVLEPARPGGGVIVGRGAVGALIVEARGQAAHAAVNPEAGRSALKALAALVAPMEALTDLAAGTVVTVGILRAGSARQVVPDHAEMHVDLRSAHAAGATRLMTAIAAILDQGRHDGIRLTTTGGFTRPAFPRAAGDALYEIYAQGAATLGVGAPALTTSGGSDGSFAAALGRPTLDGLGPVCTDTCSPREHIAIASLAERGALFAALVARLPDIRPVSRSAPR